MSAIYDKIEQAAHENEELLRGLEETDAAPVQLEQQTSHVDDLEVRTGVASKRAESLGHRAMIELGKYEKYRNSTFRRFAHKASGTKDKFTAKAAREEKEYLDTLELQKNAEDELAHTTQLRNEAEEQRKQMLVQFQRHESLQAQLDTLYNAIFAGPTPEFPEEDAKEEAYDAAYAYMQSVDQHLKHQRLILSLLNQTATKLSAASLEFNRADDANQVDMFKGGTLTVANMRKLRDIELAERTMRDVRQLQDQIKQIASKMSKLGPVNINQGSCTAEVLLDNISSNLTTQAKISQSSAQIRRARNQCDANIEQQQQLEKNLRQELCRAHSQLQHARLELQKMREDVFKSVLRGAQQTVM